MASIIDFCDNTKDYRTLQPAADGVETRVKRHVLGPFAESYGDFLMARVPSEVVERVGGLCDEKGLVRGRFSSRPFFVTDVDAGINGAIGNACALVKPGERDAPLRIVIAHTDSPCLSASSQPLWVDPDAETQLVCPSFYLLTRPHGEFVPDIWYGRDIQMVGRTFHDGRAQKVDLPGRIKELSVHVKGEDDEPKTYFGLKVETGFRDRREAYRRLGIRDSMDFAAVKLHIVPHYGRDNIRLVGNEIGGYGQDDRSCVYASTLAFLEAFGGKSPNTMMVLLLDNEEAGSYGNSAAFRGFCEAVLHETLKITKGMRSYRELTLPLDLSRGLLGGMPAISADVNVGMGPEEMAQYSRGDKISFYEGAKVGWGFCLSGDCEGADEASSSPVHLGRLSELFRTGLPGRLKKNRYQIIGPPTTADTNLGTLTMARCFNGYLPMVCMGPAGTGLHNPGCESFNVFDIFWQQKGTELYFSSI